MKKKFSLFLLTMSLILGSATTIFAATDIRGHWAETTITKWINEGRINGYPDGSFKPEDNISRAEFVVLVNKAFGYTSGASISFSDVSSNDWYYNEVAIGIKEGFVNGTSGSQFSPNAPITREQVAAILARILDLDSSEGPASALTDSGEISDWSLGSVGATVENGVLKGYTDGSFGPKNNMKRAEAVTALQSALDFKGGSGNSGNTNANKNDNQTEYPAFIPGQTDPFTPNANTNTNTNTNKDDSEEKVTAGSVIIDSSYGLTARQEIIKGNVVVSTSSTITIKNIVIEGNLTIDKSCKNVTFENCYVEGSTYIDGGSTITFKESDLGKVTVDTANVVEIVSEEKSLFGEVTLMGDAKLTEDTPGNSGFTSVNIPKKASSKPEITLSGDFTTITVDCPDTKIELKKGSIHRLDLNKDAEDTAVTLASGTEITSANIEARGASIKGSGVVKSATVDAKSVTLQKEPANVSGSEKATYLSTSEKSEIVLTLKNRYDGFITNADVYTEDGRTRLGYSNSEGKVEFSLSEGRHDIVISASGYEDHKITLSGDDGKITREYQMTEKTSNRYDITFEVSDKDGNYLSGATVKMGGSQGDTNLSGEAKLTSLLTGMYTYTITYDGESVTGKYNVTGTGTVKVDFDK